MIVANAAVVQASATGVAAVTQTVDTNRRVNALYGSLVTLLTDLLAQSGELRHIIALMHSLGNETQLLALNAAIEAAGSKASGVRFAVVAGEVKRLAERSIQASQTVTTILREIEAKIMEAVLSAERGRRETEAAVGVAEESGAVIQTLAATISQSNAGAVTIQALIEGVFRHAREIQSATDQQAIASSQAVATVEDLRSIAQQNAAGGLDVRDTARHLETAAHDLTADVGAAAEVGDSEFRL